MATRRLCAPRRCLSRRGAPTPPRHRFLAWLAGVDLNEDPLADADGRDWAVRDYRSYLQGVLKRSPATVNDALAAVDDFYIRRGLGPASAARVQLTAAEPRALDQRAQLRYLREVQRCPSPRDQALALVAFYAGARISEIVALGELGIAGDTSRGDGRDSPRQHRSSRRPFAV